MLPVSPSESRRRLDGLCGPLLVAAIATSMTASPAIAQQSEPTNWPLAESPGAAGVGFGLGIDFRWENLDSLLNAADTTTVTRRDGCENVTQVVPGDPALNNRKFDYRFEARTAGGQVPVALPRFSLGSGVSVYPSLVLEAAVTDVTFDFRDRTGRRTAPRSPAGGRATGWGWRPSPPSAGAAAGSSAPAIATAASPAWTSNARRRSVVAQPGAGEVPSRSLTTGSA